MLMHRPASHFSLSRYWSADTPSRNWFYRATLLCACCLPLLADGIQLAVAALIISWIFTPKSPLRDRYKFILLFGGIYLFHLLGMAHTSNVARGMADLMQKLSLLLMPLIFGTAMIFTRREIWNILLTFCAGTLLSVVLSLLTAYADYLSSGDHMRLFMSEFPLVHHPSYLAMYVNFAVFILAVALLCQLHPGIKGWLLVGALIFLSASLVFPASKMGFINFFFLLPAYLLAAVLIRRKQDVNSLAHIAVAGGAIAFVLLFLLTPVGKQRVAQSIRVSTNEQMEEAVAETESSTARIIVWQVALDLMCVQPFGVGTGDINDVLVSAYRNLGYTDLAEKELNPHNNYLQIGLALGIPALLWFLTSLCYPLVLSLRRGHFVYAFFLLSMLLQLSVESMLEKQDGVIYFAFFNSLLFFSLSSWRT